MAAAEGGRGTTAKKASLSSLLLTTAYVFLCVWALCLDNISFVVLVLLICDSDFQKPCRELYIVASRETGDIACYLPNHGANGIWRN